MENVSTNRTVCIAVLPFENLSGNPDHDYFSSGFVEDLITDLSHFHNLQVISSYTSKKIGSETKNELTVARELSIKYLLKGNLRRKGDQIRINTQQLDVSNGSILWAERYDAPLDKIFDIQDDIVERVAGAISAQIDQVHLAAARKKPLTSLAAYDCWLRGMDQIRKGTPAADQKARQTFEQALSIDPHYSRAYAGLSLSYFNDWSCQLWQQWDATERKAFKYAMKAIQLDDTDHITQLILGRILLYRRQFDLAEQHVDRSLALNSNDADTLVQIATCKTYLGKAEVGEKLFLKALRLNPYRNVWYYTGGSFTYFAQRKYKACIETALKGPLTDVWVDLPGFIAAAYAHMGEKKEAARYLNTFQKIFSKKIITDHQPNTEEIISWLKTANPFKREADIAQLIDGLVLAGLEFNPDRQDSAPQDRFPNKSSVQANKFQKKNNIWQISFEGTEIQIPEVKGFHDLASLLATPGAEMHCTEIMGSPDSLGEDEMVMDEKARQSYEQRIRDLHEEITEAEEMNDLGRTEKLKTELDQLTDHLSKALGMGQRTRKFNAPAERARTAVTWRIRSAIKKIDAAHPALGRHLSNAIRTGIFCCYDPEKEQAWHL